MARKWRCTDPEFSGTEKCWTWKPASAGFPFGAPASVHQPGRMVGQVLADHGLDEEIAVVIARVPPQRQRLAGGGAHLFQPFRPQLRREELVLQPLVDQQLRRPGPAGDELHRVVLGPT